MTNSNIVSDKLREYISRVLIHESGHALIIHLLGLDVKTIVFDPENKEMPGYVDWDDKDVLEQALAGCEMLDAAGRNALYTHLLVSLAGIQAELLVFGSVRGGNAQDTEVAQKITRCLAIVDDRQRYEGEYIDQAQETIRAMLEPQINVLSEVARSLMRSHTISSDEFLGIMRGFDL